MKDDIAVAAGGIALLLVLLVHVTNNTTPKTRNPCRKRKRLDWEARVKLLEETNSFHRCYKMSKPSFDALLTLLAPSLRVNEQQSINRTGIPPITPENKLQMFLRWLSGGSSHDIIAYSGTADSSFYDIIQEVATAIIDHPDLQIKFPSDDEAQDRIAQGFARLSNGGVIRGCLGAIDGWLCQINVPRKDEVSRVRSFYSGHYRCYGVNVQACVDHHGRFTAVSIANPGGTGDAAAYRQWGLAEIAKKFRVGRYLAGDNAYGNDNTLLTPFARPAIADEYHDSFNFHLSQVRIRVEMAFGLLVRKWQIFRSPLQVKFENVPRVILAACVLHNWCINRRLAEDANYQAQNDEAVLEGLSEVQHERGVAADRTSMEMDVSDYSQLYMPSTTQTGAPTSPINAEKNLVRNAIVNLLRRKTMRRPQYNLARRAREDAHA